MAEACPESAIRHLPLDEHCSGAGSRSISLFALNRRVTYRPIGDDMSAWQLESRALSSGWGPRRLPESGAYFGTDLPEMSKELYPNVSLCAQLKAGCGLP